MNTFSQREHLEARLSRLAETDSEAAAWLRSALPTAGEWPRVAPSKEWIENFNRWLAEHEKIDLALVLGAGTAGEMDFLLERLPEKARIFLMEHDPAQAAALFCNWPMEELAASGRLILAFGDDAQALEKKLALLIDVNCPPYIAIFEQSQISPAAAQFYYGILKELRRGVKLDTFNVNTLLYHGPLWQFNSLKNLPILLNNPGIQVLEKSFCGMPALIIGAGPSLNDALPFIKRNADKFVKIAAATALRPLRAAGIRPDLVAAVDASRKTAPQFQADCSDLFLACSSMAYPPALRKFRGVFNGHLVSSPIDHWMETIGQGKGYWVAAGTVTTSALDLAIKMGCDPIVAVGFDLSFAPDGTTHANQTMYHGARLDPRRLVQVPGNYQESVPTTEQFKVYIELLDEFLKHNPGPRYINATTAGARLPGMELQRPDALDAIPDMHPDAYNRIVSIHAQFAPPDPAQICGILREAVAQFDAVVNDTRTAARLCNRLMMLLKAPDADAVRDAEQYLRALKDIDDKFIALRESSLLLDMGLWPASFLVCTQTDSGGENAADPIQANRQSRQVYEQIAGAAQWTRALLLEAIDVLEEKSAAVAVA